MTERKARHGVSVRRVEQAAEAGASSILQLPPNTYRADREAVVNH